MAIMHAQTFTAHVAEPMIGDREIISQLNELGHAFENAVGAYMVDHPALFPAGTLTEKLTSEEKIKLQGLVNDRSHVNSHIMTMEDMEAHSTYYGVHMRCLFMQAEERYLSSLNVSFKEVADSIDVDVSDRNKVASQLAVCKTYGFEPIAQLLNLKLAA